MLYKFTPCFVHGTLLNEKLAGTGALNGKEGTKNARAVDAPSYKEVAGNHE